MSVRLAVAGTPVITETTAAGILAGDLAVTTQKERVAVAFADELMTQPGLISDELVAELHAHFNDVQLAELTVKILKFNVQKVLVACGHDYTMTPDLLVKAGWGGDGSFVTAP
jgi:exo-beta-1,3-glucanase (GH17 family)